MKLVVLEGPAAQHEFVVVGPDATIGRAPDCAVRLYDPQVSRHHARLRSARGRVVLEDLQPANPSIVNDRLVRGSRWLEHGDLIVMGGVLLQLDLGAERARRPSDRQPTARQPAATGTRAETPRGPAESHEAPGPAQAVTPPGQAAASAAAGPVGSGEPPGRARTSAPPGAARDRIPSPSTPSPTPPETPPPPVARSHAPLVPPAVPTPGALRAGARRLKAAGEQLIARVTPAANPPAAHHPVARDALLGLDRLVGRHQELGGDAELARFAALLHARLSNQTDLTQLFALGAEAGALAAWARLANDAIRLIDGLEQAIQP